MLLPPLDRKRLERAVAPASLTATLDSLLKNRIIRAWDLVGDRVYLDGDAVALELAAEALGAPEVEA